MTNLAQAVKRFCVQIGSKPLLVQGAGGNASWKEGGTLWVKASGTWLADAELNNIFVAVDLEHLQSQLKHDNYSASPRLSTPSHLKPSIETILHASLDFKIVVHLHAVEILAQLVKENARDLMAIFLKGSFNFIYVDYFKPGFELAEAVNKALKDNPGAEVILLANHGMVLGGDSVEQISGLLDRVLAVFQAPISASSRYVNVRSAKSEVLGYLPIADNELHILALDDWFFEVVEKFWCLYPDHVVFLGAKASVFQSWQLFRKFIADCEVLQHPTLVFIRGEGVFVRAEFGRSMLVQLRCYYDVIRRQSDASALQPLTLRQVQDLLDWDAEKHRLLQIKI